MPEFSYTARDASGKQITGSLNAGSERDAVNMLSVQNLFPVTLSSDEKKEPAFKLGSGRVKPAVIAVFYDQLSSLMANGVPLLRSLNILRDQASNPNLKGALTDIIARVEDGDTLADGFARHPKVFSEIAVNMSRAGGEGGFLEDVLKRVAVFTEQQDEMKSRTVGALIYPAVLASIGTIVVTVLMVFFVPKFGTLFDSLKANGELPWATEWLLSFSNGLQKYGILIVLFLAALYAVMR
ncbi:MAG: type II secretion system F family protein, partial [Planctomycetota bacterium]